MFHTRVTQPDKYDEKLSQLTRIVTFAFNFKLVFTFLHSLDDSCLGFNTLNKCALTKGSQALYNTIETVWLGSKDPESHMQGETG